MLEAALKAYVEAYAVPEDGSLHEVPRKETRWMHRKTRSVYRVHMIALREEDLTPLVLYQNLTRTTIWARPVSEFLDGRFKPVDP